MFVEFARGTEEVNDAVLQADAPAAGVDTRDERKKQRAKKRAQEQRAEMDELRALAAAEAAVAIARPNTALAAFVCAAYKVCMHSSVVC